MDGRLLMSPFTHKLASSMNFFSKSLICNTSSCSVLFLIFSLVSSWIEHPERMLIMQPNKTARTLCDLFFNIDVYSSDSISALSSTPVFVPLDALRILSREILLTSVDGSLKLAGFSKSPEISIKVAPLNKTIRFFI